jgi:AraC-like DNA-binding protein
MTQKSRYRWAESGVENFPKGTAPARHGHWQGYASVILTGAFVEAGFGGRANATSGDVLLHGRFDFHSNRSTCSRTVQILRLPWRDEHLEGHFRIDDPDLLARVAERDPEEALSALTLNLRPAPAAPEHWTARLALDLQTTTPLSLRRWAEKAGVRPDELSRGFHSEFGISPKRFRLETRARRAWREVLQSTQSLTTIAHDFGFSDLAHLSRSIRFLTGFPPSFWRSGGYNSVQAGRTRIA